ncbi:unnamed protein product [Fusarium graminearum]|uniref:Uncharacterized protein n=1 Tax=Gibberella zeae TaxID=5518 RepID=A0A9N8RBR4_GIBZA|nr:unnamed protein product [Fusarium graminearum]CAG1981825.1 unnamed protein product [Fusarium graminearum]
MTHFATCLQVYGISVDDGLPFNGTYNAMVFHLRIDMLFACGLHDHGYELSAPNKNGTDSVTALKVQILAARSVEKTLPTHQQYLILQLTILDLNKIYT